MWSQRNNNNYTLTGLLTSLSYYAANNKLFLKNFYLKAKRSVLKAKTEGPAAYVFPADDPRPGLQADLLRVLQTQRCEISRATAPFTVTRAREEEAGEAGRRGRRGQGGAEEGREADRDPAVPGRLVHRPDGPAVQPHRRRAARLPVLEPERSAEEPVRRHRLDVRRAVQRAGGARGRPEGARRADGAGEGARAARRDRHRHRDALRRQPRYRLRICSRCVTGSRTSRSTRPRSRSRRPGARSTAAASSSRAARPPTSRRPPPNSASSSYALAAAPSVKTHPVRVPAHRLRPHLAEHAGRGLVAARARRPEDPVRLHQHADGRGDARPQREVRRHPVPARRPQRRSRSSRACRCGATRCRGRRPT